MWTFTMRSLRVSTCSTAQLQLYLVHLAPLSRITVYVRKQCMMGPKGKCCVCKAGWNYHAFYLTYTNTNCRPNSGQRHHVVSVVTKVADEYAIFPPSGSEMEAGISSKTVVNQKPATRCRNQGQNPKFDRREYSVPKAQKTQIYSITNTKYYLTF